MRNRKCRAILRSRGDFVRTSANTIVKRFDFTQQPGSSWREWLYDSMSLEQAEELERQGKVQRVTRLVSDVIEVVGFQNTAAEPASEPSPTSLTPATMRAIAAATGTRPRLTRKDWEHLEKFVAWAFVGDEKNLATVRPRTSEREKRRHAEMQRCGYLRQAA